MPRSEFPGHARAKASKTVRACTATAMLIAAVPLTAQVVEELPDRSIGRGKVKTVVLQQFASMDADHDGVVTPAEFDQYRRRQSTGRSMGPLTRIGPRWFARTDTNGDGKVTRDEAMARPLRFFDLADTNHDGTVSLEERRIAVILFKIGGR